MTALVFTLVVFSLMGLIVLITMGLEGFMEYIKLLVIIVLGLGGFLIASLFITGFIVELIN